MIEQAGDQTHQGYSAVLDLHLRWEQGELGWYDPATGRHIVRFDDEREARLAAEARADTTEARLRELEAELERCETTLTTSPPRRCRCLTIHGARVRQHRQPFSLGRCQVSAAGNWQSDNQSPLKSKALLRRTQLSELSTHPAPR